MSQRLTRVIALFFCIALTCRLASGQTTEARLRPLQAGDQTLTGFVLPEPTSTTGFIVEVYDVSGGGHKFVDRKPIDRFERGGAFSVQLTAPLRANQRVEVSLNGALIMNGTLDIAAPPAPQPPSVHLRLPHAGDVEVAGVISPAPKSPATGLAVDVTSMANEFIARKAIDRVDADTGAFSVTLAAALQSTQRVSVVGPVAANSATVPSFEATVVLSPSLYDGSRTVKGYVEGAAKGGWVRVQVLRSGLENSNPRSAPYLQMKRVPTDDLGNLHEFAASLDQPLVAGQVVVAVAFTAAEEASTKPAATGTVTDPGSWGRARAYFAGGVVFSKGVDDFSKQDLSLTFAIDKGWLQRPDFQLGANIPPEVAARINNDETARKACKSDRNPKGCDAVLKDRIEKARTPYQPTGGMAFRQFNTFFDTRLTALPVTVPPASTTTTTSTTTGATTTSAQTTSKTTSGTSQFIDSRKGAVLEIGAYAPFYGPQTSWVHEGAVNALYIAPVARVGIQTIPGDSSGAPTVNAKGEPDDVFHFWSIGFGVGHQKLSGTTNQTPEIISYLHITWGRSEAFEYKKQPTDTDVVNPLRTMVEGRLKIPSTALQIGFDANLGDGRDDVRFIFGTRFDIGEVFSRLRGF